MNLIAWIALCKAAIIVSVFVHEVIHGFTAKLCGMAVSTGFNRVGDAYKFPSDPDFRKNLYSDDNDVNDAPDYAPQFNLALAAIFTLLFIFMPYTGSLLNHVILAFALGNSVIRLIPSAVALIARRNEDEIGQGYHFALKYDRKFLYYVPAVISVAVSIVCLYFIRARIESLRLHWEAIPNMWWIWPAFVSSLVICNILDKLLRINWVPKKTSQ